MVFAGFTFVSRPRRGKRESGTRIESLRARAPRLLETAMEYLPYLADRRDVTEADNLVRLFGDDAGFEAAARADKSRDIGNHLHFCRWRQIERLVVLMSIGRAVGTVH
jgi:hypothetical protein